jgi:hypothetical protein
MGIYMGGRQIFETSQEVHIREEDNKLNKQVMDKLLIQMSLLSSVILVNAIIFIVIVIL